MGYLVITPWASIINDKGREMNNFYTTFNELHEQQACSKRYKYLVKKLGGIKKYGKDTPIKYSRILEINGLEDTLWSLEKKDSDVNEYVLQLFMVGVAYNVLHFFEGQYPNDNRVRKAIKIRHLYAHGEALKEELEEAVARILSASLLPRSASPLAAALSTGAFTARAASRDARWASQNSWSAENEFQQALLAEILKDVEGNVLNDQES